MKNCILYISGETKSGYTMVILMCNNECEYQSMLPVDDVMNFISDLSLTRRNCTVEMTKGHSLFIQIKKIGFNVKFLTEK